MEISRVYGIADLPNGITTTIEEMCFFVIAVMNLCIVESQHTAQFIILNLL